MKTGNAKQMAAIQFTIYNRWGRIIFFLKIHFQDWDGTINAVEQPAGTYVWVCNYQLAGEVLHLQKGTVT